VFCGIAGGAKRCVRTQLRGCNHNIYSQSTWIAGAPNSGTNYIASDTRTIDYFKSKGMSMLRLMFTWEWLQDAVLDTIPGAGAYLTYWNAFVATVNYATSLGMTVMIEHYGASDNFWGGGGANTTPSHKGVGSGDGVSYTRKIGGGTVTNAHFSDLWSQLATYFKNNPRVEFGMCNEPHDMSTLTWFGTAQAVITAIRATGATQRIYVPGNGYASWDWESTSVDNAGTPRSNSYGWENAGGTGVPLSDPLNNLVAVVHMYMDDAGGSTADVDAAIVAVGAGTEANAAADRLAPVVNWARTYNAAHPGKAVRVFVGEIGFKNTYTNATACWDAFAAYCLTNKDVVIGWAWWGASDIGWWTDVGETHFSISPTTTGTPYTGDTANMNMIENDFT
jgi:endoglucanase